MFAIYKPQCSNFAFAVISASSPAIQLSFLINNIARGKVLIIFDVRTKSPRNISHLFVYKYIAIPLRQEKRVNKHENEIYSQPSLETVKAFYLYSRNDSFLFNGTVPLRCNFYCSFFYAKNTTSYFVCWFVCGFFLCK